MKIRRTIGVLVITVVAAVSVRSQEATKPQSTSPQSTDKSAAKQPTATPDYVFPTPRERFNRYVKSTVGPERLLRTGVSAGISQWRDSPEEWSQGMKGYGKRYASHLGRNAIQQTVTYGLDMALQFDTGFQKSKRQGFFPRLKDALIQNVTSRNRSGDRVFAVPRFAGVYTGAVIATETWYPERYSYKDGLRRGTRSLLMGFGINVVREFVISW